MVVAVEEEEEEPDTEVEADELHAAVPVRMTRTRWIPTYPISTVG